MTERAGAGHFYTAGLRRFLVGQRDLALERATDRRNSQLHLDLVGVMRDLDHRLAAGDATRQHRGIVQRFPQRLDRSLDGLVAADVEFHGRSPYRPNSFCTRPPLIEARSASENLVSVTILVGARSPIGNGMSDPMMTLSAPTTSAR